MNNNIFEHLVDQNEAVNDKSKVRVKCSFCTSIYTSLVKTLKSRIKKSLPSCRTCSIKRLWERPEYSLKIKESQKQVWSNPDVIKQISNSSKENWKRPEYIDEQLRIHSDPSYIEETRIRSKKLWEDDIFRTNQKKIRSNPDWIKNQSNKMRDLWKSDEYKSKVAKSLSEVFATGFRSSIESITNDILTNLRIEFVEQKPVGPWIFDFFLPEHDVFIECQGEYWHSFPDRRSRDAAKNTYFEQSKPNSRILYLVEKEFLNQELIKHKIKKFLNKLNDDSDLITKEFSFSQIEVREIDVKLNHKGVRSEAVDFLNSYHYAQFGRSAKVVFGGYIDNKLIAVCKFSSPIRKEVATSMNFSYSSVLELDRFCIHPNFHKKNFASWMISRCSNLAFMKYMNVIRLISFADSTYGHDGTIYKASNWSLLGTIAPDYNYIDSDGWMIHKKTLWNHASKNSKSEKDYAVFNGYTKVYGKEKYKFFLDRRI